MLQCRAVLCRVLQWPSRPECRVCRCECVHDRENENVCVSTHMFPAYLICWPHILSPLLSTPPTPPFPPNPHTRTPFCAGPYILDISEAQTPAKNAAGRSSNGPVTLVAPVPVSTTTAATAATRLTQPRSPKLQTGRERKRVSVHVRTRERERMRDWDSDGGRD